MNILLDTHIAIWAIVDDNRLTQKARDLILDSGNNIYYSALSVLEVNLKTKSRHNNLTFSTEEFNDMCLNAGYIHLPLKAEHIIGANCLEWIGEGMEHQDPFDRMLLAQAIEEKMHFMTSDSKIPNFKQRCVISV